MIKKTLFLYAFVLLFISSFSQNLPSTRSVDWTLAGVKDSSTVDFLFLNVIDFGIVNDGISVNDSILNYIITNEVNQGAILYFPEGEYLFNENIILENNIVVRGAGSDSTVFILDMDTTHGFVIEGELSTDTSFLLETAIRDNNYLIVQNASQFSLNDWVQIIQNDSNLVTSSWALKTVGQIIQIHSVSDDTLWLKSPLRLEYDLSKSPFIIKHLPKQNIGLECFKILRIDNPAPFQASNIFFDKAVNCWVKGIESQNCTFSHVQARFSSNIHISNSYFHEAFEYGGGGRAYGVMLHLTSNECKVDNSVFRYLRHSMILQAGANANVFAYNYSIEPNRTELPNNIAGDMVLHGNYPYSNLFEHNICQNISIDNSHGPNGPYNTFFRNRAELWGIFFTAFNSGNQNLIGNEITNLDPNYINFNYTINGPGHFIFANNNKGIVVPVSTDIVTDSTYSYISKPDFLYNKPWAFIGNPDSFDLGNIPSKSRFLDSLLINAYCFEDKIEVQQEDTVIETGITDLRNDILIFPNPSSGIIHIKTDFDIEFVQIFDLTGNLLYNLFLNTSEKSINIKELPKGIYILKRSNKKGQTQVRKLLLK